MDTARQRPGHLDPVKRIPILGTSRRLAVCTGGQEALEGEFHVVRRHRAIAAVEGQAGFQRKFFHRRRNLGDGLGRIVAQLEFTAGEADEALGAGAQHVALDITRAVDRIEVLDIAGNAHDDTVARRPGAGAQGRRQAKGGHGGRGPKGGAA